MVHLLPLLSTAILLIGAIILATPATGNNVAPAPIDAISVIFSCYRVGKKGGKREKREAQKKRRKKREERERRGD